MNILEFLWNTVFYHPIVNLILFIYKYLGGNLGLSIILLTILVRLVLWPFMKTQVDAMKKMQAMKPKLDELKKKYPNDKKKYQEEQLKLYRESGTNPAGSCLPLLIQLPFIYAVYNVIRIVSSSSSASVFNNIAYGSFLKLPHSTHFNTNFLGINLAKDAASFFQHDIKSAIPYIIVALLVGLTQYFASKVSMPVDVQETTEAVEIIEEKTEPKGKKAQKKAKAIANEINTKKEDSSVNPEEFSKALSTQMLYIFPVILVWISLGFSGHIPAGLSIYWVVQSVVVVIQTLILQGKIKWNPLKSL